MILGISELLFTLLGEFIENQIILSRYENAFSSRLTYKNAEIAASKNKPGNPYSNADAFINAHQTATDRIKSILSTDPFLQRNTKWISDFNQRDPDRERETYTISTNVEKSNIKQAILLFEIFYALSIKYYDLSFAQNKFPILYQVMQTCFHNPVQDKNNVYAWSDPIYFYLERLRQTANDVGEQYNRKIKNRGGAKLFSEPRTISSTATLDTLDKAILEKDWFYAIALAKAFQTQLLPPVIMRVLSLILSEDNSLPWQKAQLQFVIFLFDQCDTEDEAQQEIISAVITCALACAKNNNNKQLAVITLQNYLFCITTVDDLKCVLT